MGALAVWYNVRRVIAISLTNPKSALALAHRRSFDAAPFDAAPIVAPALGASRVQTPFIEGSS